MTKGILAALIIGLVLIGGVCAQTEYPESGTVTLESRGADNYIKACFSFEKGANGEEGLKLTRNAWDLQFSSIRRSDKSVVRDQFHVKMVGGNRSRIKDLGPLDWSADPVLQELKPLETGDTKDRVEAVVGHLYLVRTVDRDSDFYSLFRVDKLVSGESVTITWKRLPPPTEK